MEKICIFCNRRPQNRNKEHVIPKWLIELTGDPNRIIELGPYFGDINKNNKIGQIRFSFNSFQFPACEECNSLFSDLESKSRQIIENILNSKYIKANEISILLDWFDKVRVGLWLGYLYLSKRLFQLNPKFGITDRIGQADRSIVVFKFNDNNRGIQFSGTNLPCFAYNPSCFALTINNYIFLNISHNYIFSKNFGLPYPCKAIIQNDRTHNIELAPGTEQMKYPLTEIPIFKNGIELYQPVIDNRFHSQEIEVYQTSYVKNIFQNLNKGKIFFAHDNKLDCLGIDDEILLNPSIEFDRDQFIRKFTRYLISTQTKILNNSPLKAHNENTSLTKKLIGVQLGLFRIKNLK